jgi:hypothetical protein
MAGSGTNRSAIHYEKSRFAVKWKEGASDGGGDGYRVAVAVGSPSPCNSWPIRRPSAVGRHICAEYMSVISPRIEFEFAEIGRKLDEKHLTTIEQFATAPNI